MPSISIVGLPTMWSFFSRIANALSALWCLSRLSFSAFGRRRGSERERQLSNSEDSLAVEIRTLLFAHTAEQAEVVFVDRLLAAAGLKFALGAVSIQDEVGGRRAGN